MKMFKKMIIVLFIFLVYFSAVILVPIAGKMLHKKDYRQIVYSENIVGNDTIYELSGNQFVMYIDYEDDKKDYYKKFKELDMLLFLSVYEYDDLTHYDDDIFDGIFIKSKDEKEIIINEVGKSKTRIRLLTDNLLDYDKYNKKVEMFAFENSIIDEASKKYSREYFYMYAETTSRSKEEIKVDYLKRIRTGGKRYGLLLYIKK